MRHGKRVSNVPKVEVLRRYFKEANLMDSSGSNFEVGVDVGADDSPNVSLVSKTKLENVSDVEANESSGGRSLCRGNKGRGGGRLQVMVQSLGSTHQKVKVWRCNY